MSVELSEFYRHDERAELLRSYLYVPNKENDSADHLTTLHIGSCHGSFSAILIAAAFAKECVDKRPQLIISPKPEDLVQDLRSLDFPAVYFPALDFISEDFSDDSPRDTYNQGRRIQAIQDMQDGSCIVCSSEALFQPIPPLQSLEKNARKFALSETLDADALLDELVEDGYHVVQLVERRGDIAVRGGIIDIFPWVSEHPIRIELFGDEIDALRRFDPLSQESTARFEHISLCLTNELAATNIAWDCFDERAHIELADIPLRERRKNVPKHPCILLARQLAHEAEDGGCTSIKRYRGDLLRSGAELQSSQDCDIIALARNEEAALQLQNQGQQLGLEKYSVITARLQEGFRDQISGRIYVHDFELYERKPVRKAVRVVHAGQALSSLNDLKVGDYVVHVRYGVSIFRGMSTLEKNGFYEDFLLLEFAEESKLHVPVRAIDLVQKYIGGGKDPELHKIGGQIWKKKREQAEKAIEDLTGELLEAQAKRIAAGGICFLADGPETQRFNARFPYEETEDQLVAIRAITHDMERNVAMDRLLCGDVGFGKTEVAMRASFKAVHSHYQVAVLAPTTILSEQHAQQFTQRFAETGIHIACMNRFRSDKEKRKILEDCSSGKIDILIGTHALLTEKLHFHNLGLLVVDEEQRFGVKHKEFLKKMRAGVDVLTLSATPIPRTLHGGMIGLRDISVLAEAPAERRAVMTRVAPWSDELITQALKREAERDGQIFVVHNRVKDLDHVAFRLQRLLPNLRIDMLHGQMSEQRIASTMSAYKRCEIDCLVATSIIESGLDFPNANTLIVNNAHCFGLSELHQIRGRVGRHTRQAYAYFVAPPPHRLNNQAIERLDAIAEYCELGAGFKLALRDLEIRGAGNILGSEQSGHMEAIGYELYCKLLNEAVERLGGEGQKQGVDTLCTLHFALDAYIPADYLDAPALKFQLHKEIDDARKISELAGTVRRAQDRYGLPPAAVQRLFIGQALRIAAAELGCSGIDWQRRKIIVRFEKDLPKLSLNEIKEIHHVEADNKAILLHSTFMADEQLISVEQMHLLLQLFHVDLQKLGLGPDLDLSDLFRVPS